MDRPTRWKARLTLAIVAAYLLAAAPAAPAAAPAGDEYVLQLPGVRQTDNNIERTSGGGGDGIQRGVVGETDGPASPLAAIGDALAAIPASIAAGLVALLALALLAMPRRLAADRLR